MKIAVISDIHSNLPALHSVAKDIQEQGVDEIYCLGDILGYGPNPSECFDFVTKFVKGTVKGNHEDAMSSYSTYDALNRTAQNGVTFSKKNISQEMRDTAKQFPYIMELKEHDIVLCHGSYTCPEEFNYITSVRIAEKEIVKIPNRLCLVGHTHSPFVYGEKSGLFEFIKDDLVLFSEEKTLKDELEKYIINVGSVGQPRDGDCRSSYGILEFKDDKVIFNLRRCFYDIEKTAQAIYATTLPDYLADRLFKGE